MSLQVNSEEKEKTKHNDLFFLEISKKCVLICGLGQAGLWNLILEVRRIHWVSVNRGPSLELGIKLFFLESNEKLGCCCHGGAHWMPRSLKWQMSAMCGRRGVFLN